MRFIALALIAGFLSVGVYSCQHKAEAPQPASNGNTGGTGGTGGTGSGSTGPDTSLCFERDILPIFISNCAKSGCHDASSHQEGFVVLIS